MWIGVDAHKRVHQAVVLGRDGEISERTIDNTPEGWASLLAWAQQWPERLWAVEGSGSLGRGVAQSSWFAPSGGSGKPAGAPHQVSPLCLLDHYLTQEDRRTHYDPRNASTRLGSHGGQVDAIAPPTSAASRA